MKFSALKPTPPESCKPNRPALRYHGGKWRLAPWLMSFFSPHKVYVEPFAGGANVLLRKPRSHAEVYNDLDGEVVNVFRMIRDRGPELLRMLELTPFANEEFKDAFYPSDDPLEQARRTIARSFMGFGSASVTQYKHSSRIGKPTTGFRANSNRSGTTPAKDWMNYPRALKLIVERLQGLVIENRDYREVIAQHDGAASLFYVDPPYLAQTRDRGADYAHEMTDADHRELLAILNQVEGMVILSGYESDLYTSLLKGWQAHRCNTFADGARPRIEVAWLNEAAVAAREASNRQPEMFA